MKTLIFHDTFLMRGGAERMNIEIAKIFDADIATATWSENCYESTSMGFFGKIMILNPHFKRGMLGFLRMKWLFFNSKKITEGYTHIFFSNEAITGIWRVKPHTKTYYYAHSISRHLFDQRNQYVAKVPFLLRPLFLLFSIFLRWLYKQEIRKVDTLFVNSKMNQQRVSEWLGRNDAIVVYPSVDTELFRIFDKNTISQILAIESIHQSYKGYYISFSRLTHAKRIDTIIRAFQKLPDQKIIILYGENDSQKEEFKKMGSGFPNIIFHTLRENTHLPTIISGAIASIAISENEDFGMVAIESMACGTPVIAVDEGGYQESIIPGKTGYLIGPKDLEKNLIQTIQDTRDSTFQAMSRDCREQSEKFSIQNMKTQLQQYIY